MMSSYFVFTDTNVRSHWKAPAANTNKNFVAKRVLHAINVQSVADGVCRKDCTQLHSSLI